jgi:hypothetical protein
MIFPKSNFRFTQMQLISKLKKTFPTYSYNFKTIREVQTCFVFFILLLASEYLMTMLSLRVRNAQKSNEIEVEASFRRQ